MFLLIYRLGQSLYSTSIENEIEISLCEISACFEKCTKSNIIVKGAIYRFNEPVYFSLAWNFSEIIHDFVYIEEIFLSCDQYNPMQRILMYRDG